MEAGPLPGESEVVGHGDDVIRLSVADSVTMGPDLAPAYVPDLTTAGRSGRGRTRYADRSRARSLTHCVDNLRPPRQAAYRRKQV